MMLRARAFFARGAPSKLLERSVLKIKVLKYIAKDVIVHRSYGRKPVMRKPLGRVPSHEQSSCPVLCIAIFGISLEALIRLHDAWRTYV